MYKALKRDDDTKNPSIKLFEDLLNEFTRMDMPRSE